MNLCSSGWKRKHTAQNARENENYIQIAAKWKLCQQFTNIHALIHTHTHIVTVQPHRNSICIAFVTKYQPNDTLESRFGWCWHGHRYLNWLHGRVHRDREGSEFVICQLLLMIDDDVRHDNKWVNVLFCIGKTFKWIIKTVISITIDQYYVVYKMYFLGLLSTSPSLEIWRKRVASAKHQIVCTNFIQITKTHTHTERAS